jgi:hypothetical protein
MGPVRGDPENGVRRGHEAAIRRHTLDLLSLDGQFEG